MSEVKKRKSRTIENVVTAFFFVLLVVIALQMNSLYAKINSQDVIINNQYALIRAQNSTIQAKMNQIASLTQSLNNLNARLAQDNITIQRLLSQHKVDLNTIGNLSSKVAADEKMIDSLRSQLASNENMIVFLQTQLDYYKSMVSQLENLLYLNVSTRIGTKTFQLYPGSSGQCNYDALFTFTASYAGYLVINGSFSSPYTVVDVNYGTDITSASSWFVASYLQSSINAIVPIYPSTITIYVQNCDSVPISGSLTVVEHT